MKTTKVYGENWLSYRGGANIIVNKGSSRSSKTFSILQLFYTIATYSKRPLVMSVVSRALPHLKSGAMRDFDMILLDDGIIPDKVKNKTESYYKINNSIIEFFGADQLDKVHGPSRDLLFINEAYFIKYDVYVQLSLRTSGTIFIDYNPIQRYWLDDEVIPNEKPVVIHSTYKDNDYLPEGIRRQLDLKLDRYYKEKASGRITKAYENWCKVYLFGEDGVLEGAIYENWRYAEPGELDEAFSALSYGYGLDYGYHPDPDAMVKVAIDQKRKKIYLQEKIYSNYNGTEDLIGAIKRFYKQGELIIAESASPRTNADLKKHFNIKPVRKIKTVVDWIRELQDYELIVDPESYNLVKELQNYVWSDKKAGIPVDAYNHCFVADTKIATTRGDVNICNVITGDYVATSEGYRKVVKRFNNGRKKIFVYHLYFNDICIELKCTNDHKIKTDKGWKQIKDLRTKDKVYLFRYLTEKSIENTKGNAIFQEEQRGFIPRYGSSIKEKYPKDITYTTLMKIQKTIELRIFNWLMDLNTLAIIAKKEYLKIKSGSISFKKWVLKLHQNGIKARRVQSGTRSIMKNTDIKCILPEKESVKSAVKNTLLGSTTKNFAQTIASQHTGERMDSTTKQDIAYDVDQSLRATNIQNKDFADIHVLTKIDVKRKSEEQVYDLMIDGVHEYFANGVLVHNCCDSFRYYYMQIKKPDYFKLV